MRIIKKGKLPEEKLYRCTCTRCNTEFEFAAKEAQYNSDQRDGDFYTVGCPFCGQSCYVQAHPTTNWGYLDR